MFNVVAHLEALHLREEARREEARQEETSEDGVATGASSLSLEDDPTVSDETKSAFLSDGTGYFDTTA